MAERPIFVPAKDDLSLVKEIYVPLHWHSGFAPIQKEKNIRELHASALALGLGPLLEVSSKSDRVEGRHLSAFHLKVQTRGAGLIPLECAFQGSKIFEYGGPYRDIFFKEAREAKRDARIRESGSLRGFEFEGYSFALDPKTFFYDWLYISSIYPHRDFLRRLNVYAGFTDIELNPYRSINCQARSIALFMTLMNRNLLDEAMQSPEDFRRLLLRYDYRAELREMPKKSSSVFIERNPNHGFYFEDKESEGIFRLFPTQEAAIDTAITTPSTEPVEAPHRFRSNSAVSGSPKNDELPSRKYR